MKEFSRIAEQIRHFLKEHKGVYYSALELSEAMTISSMDIRFICKQCADIECITRPVVVTTCYYDKDGVLEETKTKIEEHKQYIYAYKGEA